MTTIFADSNRARIRTVRSVDGWGTTPTSGKTRELRFTGSTITAQKQTQTSDEIRADRMVSDIVEVGARTSGDINVEFSAGSHDDFMEAFAFGAWTRPMTFDSVKGDILSWSDSKTLLVSGEDVSAYFISGHRVRTSGFVNAANNAYFEISTVAYNVATDVTTFVMTSGAAVAEVGTPVSALYDANDVILRANTAIRAATGGASTFDSNGSNAFAAAIAAGQLTVGQKVFVESPLGFGKGSFAFAAQPVAGDQVSVNDGVNPPLTFQFGGVGSNTVNLLEIGANTDATADTLAQAINAARANGQLELSATVANATTGGSATPSTVNVVNLEGAGGALAVAKGAATAVNFTGGDNTQRGVFKLIAITDDVLTVEPAPNTNANAAAAPITLKGSMLRNPSDPTAIVAPDYVYEVGFTDVSQYFISDGLKIGGMKYEVTSGQILKGSYTMQGARTIRQSTSLLGSAAYTPLATTATEVINATVNVGEIKMNGAGLSTALQSISFDGENNLRDQMAVSSKFPVGIGAGRQEIKGSVKAYFADGSLWDEFINHTYFSLEFSFTDGEDHHYEWTIPSAVFSTDTVAPQAGNQDVMEDIEYMARRDPVTDCQFQIDRFSNVIPVTG